MPRFFFHLHECGTRVTDDEGQTLPDADAARVAALRAAREIMCEEIKQGRLCLSCHVEIVDEDSGIAIMVPFREAVEITG